MRDADRAGAAALLREALDLWRGPVLVGDASDRLRDRVGAELVELRLSATELLVDTELALGQHRELIGELIALTAEHPHHERFVGQLMLAVYRAGRETEALEIYERFRARLAAELGVDPGPELRRLRLGVLRHDLAAVGVPPPWCPRRPPRPPNTGRNQRCYRPTSVTSSAGNVSWPR